VKLSWQHVTVVGLVVAGVIVLAVLGRDTSAFIGLAVAILLGVGLVQQGEIKNAANGNTSRLVSLMEIMTNHLANAGPAVSPSPSSAPETQTAPQPQDHS